MYRDATGFAQGIECFYCRLQFHALIGGLLFTAAQFFFMLAHAQ
jgi:hypothetical protein